MPRIIYKDAKGKKLPGVTTIIGGNLGWSKAPLMYWAWKEGKEGRDYRETRDEAANIGTIAHAMVEADLKGEEYDLDKALDTYGEELVTKAAPCVDAFQDWKQVNDFEMIQTELSIVSDEYFFGGTLDVAGVQEHHTILDLKTSNGVYEDHVIQLAAYTHLYNNAYRAKSEEDIEPIRTVGLLRLSKTGTFHYHEWKAASFKPAWESFLALLKLHYERKGIKSLLSTGEVVYDERSSED